MVADTAPALVAVEGLGAVEDLEAVEDSEAAEGCRQAEVHQIKSITSQRTLLL